MGFLDGLLGGGSTTTALEGVVMQMLSNSGGQNQVGGQTGGQAGGIGGMIGSLMGGGGAPAGIQGLVSAFEQNGLGHLAQSWISDGPNHPVSPDQVQQALGDDQVQAMASQTGMPKEDLLAQLAQMLPGLVDRMTPQGQVPHA